MRRKEIELKAGRAVTICLLEYKEENYTHDFIESLEKEQKKKLIKLLAFIAEKHPLRNLEKYKKVCDDLFEIKSYQQRLFCFQRERKLIITHGHTKKKNALSKSEIERAIRLRRYYDEE